MLVRLSPFLIAPFQGWLSRLVLPRPTLVALALRPASLDLPSFPRCLTGNRPRSRGTRGSVDARSVSRRIKRADCT